MQPRSLIFTAFLLVSSLPAEADFIGLYIGGGYWNGDFSGDVIDDVSVDGELNISGDSSNYLYAHIEHPLPLIPNIRVARTSIDDSGVGTLNTNFTYEGVNFNAGQVVRTDIDLTHTDFTLYYEVIDVGMDLDVGLTARYLDGQVDIDGVKETADTVLPMLYLRGKVGLPFTGTYFGGDINAVSYSGNTLMDYSLAVGWETENFILPEFGIEAGYRRFSLDVDEDDADINIDMDVDGIFVNLTAHF